MNRVGSGFVVAILVFLTYIVFSGSISLYDIVTGATTGIVLGAVFSLFVVKNPSKVINPIKWIWLITYAVYYFFVAEVKAHLDVMYRIIHPKTPVKPAVVKVPYDLSTDYAIACVANSITNTPGTVVVDIDPGKKVYFIHWIYAQTIKPDEARKHISLTFEKYSRKIFE